MAKKSSPATIPSLLLRIVEGGPFRSLSVRFLAGVAVLCGPNNWGKSWILRQLARFNDEVKLRVGDLTFPDEEGGGVSRVFVEGFGMEAEMTAEDGAVPKIDGTPPPIEALPEPIEALMSGAYRKSPGAAFRARLEALVQWLALTSTESMLRTLLGEDDEVSGLYGRVVSAGGKLVAKATSAKDLAIVAGVDLIDGSDKIREAIMNMARGVQTRLDVAKAEVEGLTRRRDGIVKDAGSTDKALAKLSPAVESVRTRLEDSRREASRLTLLRETGLVENARNVAALAALGDPPDVDAAEERCEAAKGAYNRATIANSDAHAEVVRLREELAVAEAIEKEREVAWEAAHLASVAASRDVEEARRQASAYADTKTRLSARIEVPTADEVEAAERKVSELETNLELHRAAERYHEVAASLDAAREEAAKLEARHGQLRDEAAAVWGRLATEVNTAIEGGRLRVGESETIEIEIDGEWFDFTDADHVGEGVRWDACYELLLAHRKHQRVIVVEKCTAIDPAHLQRLGRMAREQGIILILERQPGPKDDQVRTVLEVYGGDGPEVEDFDYERVSS